MWDSYKALYKKPDWLNNVPGKITLKRACKCHILPKELPGLDEIFGLDESSVLLLMVFAVDFLGTEAGGDEEDGLPALGAGLADVAGMGASLALGGICSVLPTGPATAKTGFFSGNTLCLVEMDSCDSVNGELVRSCWVAAAGFDATGGNRGNGAETGSGAGGRTWDPVVEAAMKYQPQQIETRIEYMM